MNIIYFCIQILLPVEIQNTWERESFFDIEWANDKTEHCNVHGLDKIFTFQLCITNSISIFYETILRRFFLVVVVVGRDCIIQREAWRG